MEHLIPIVGKLQDVLGALGQTTTINLPQIVVIGGQSSGKSSVLEGLVGKSFLPRGTGIVTRRPLILQLINTSRQQDNNVQDNNENDKKAKDNDNNEEWGEFLHAPNKKYDDFKQIQEEIINDTKKLLGDNKGISSKPISLKIYSPNVLQLTLVDLPGIAKVAIGDQPADIEHQIRNMCLEYISNPNAIIVAVTAANTDIANSDGIQMALNVDPLGQRTIGVLTKIDLMDPGTDVTEILANKLIPLRRGYIAIVNRGQLDIDNNTNIKDGLSKEQSFFITNTVYRHYASKCGSYNLAKALNSILMHHIRDCLPELRSRIVSMLCDVQNELDALGEPMNISEARSTMGGALLGLLSKFATNFTDCIDGKGVSEDGLEMNELYGGARIAFIFNEVFVRSLMSIHPFDSLTDDEIRTTICNANGTRTALFVPEISFELLVKRQIRRLEQPGLQCVDLVFDELQRITSHCEPSEFIRFPMLKEKMVDVVGKLLRNAVAPTQMMVSNLIQIELAYINTSHPDFIRGSTAVAQLMDKLATNHGITTKNATNNNDTPIRHPIQNFRQDNNNQSATSSNFDHHDDTNDTPNVYPEQNGISNHNASTTTTSDNNNSGGDGGNLMNFIFRGKPNNDNNHNQASNSKQPTVTSSYPPTIVQLPQIPDTMRCQTDLPTNREKIETEIIKSLIQSYFTIVTKNFIDLVPKTIMYFLVNHAKDSMQNELVSELYNDKLIPELMSEADDVAQRRRTCSEMRDLLGKAMEIVNEVRDFNTFK